MLIVFLVKDIEKQLLTFLQCWAMNVKAPHTLLKAAKDTFLKNLDGGVLMTTGSIAVCFYILPLHPLN
jgi:hypothetical protein